MNEELETKIELTNEPEVKNEVKEENEAREEEPTPTPASTEVEPGAEEVQPADGGTRTLEGKEEKMIPQSEVNRLVGSTRQEAREKARAELRDELKQEVMREFFEKFGVQDEAEMDNVFGKGQQYDILNEDFTRQGSDLTAMREENVLLKSDIIPEKWEDAKLILKGKGLEITPENIAQEMATHPEWNKVQESAKQGNDVNPALKLFGESTETKPQGNGSDEFISKFFKV